MYLRRRLQLDGLRGLRVAADGMRGIFELRHPDDAARLRSAAAAASSAIVIGGGYIGLEVAATLAKSGKDVTVIEAAPRLLARLASPAISAFFVDLHADARTTVITDAGVEGIESVHNAQDSAFAPPPRSKVMRRRRFRRPGSGLNNSGCACSLPASFRPRQMMWFACAARESVQTDSRSEASAATSSARSRLSAIRQVTCSARPALKRDCPRHTTL